MNDIPLVSATVVCYNQEMFIAECLDSILSQDYKNFEIIVSDDCSTDNTQNILKAYETRYPGKIIVNYNANNLGITKNSNKALLLSKGEFITFTAGDDVMLPGKITTQVSHMVKNPECVISYHNSEVFCSETKEIISYSKYLSYSGRAEFIDLIKKGCFIGGCEAMVRRRHIPAYGYDERLPIGSDWKLYLDIMENGGEIHYIDEILAAHRRHNNNITSNYDPNIRLRSFQDLLVTCVLIESKYPKFSKSVAYRQATIYRSMRNINFSESYQDYLKLSVSKKITMKTMVLLMLSLFGINK